MKAALKILIVDDSVIFRSAVAEALKTEPGIDIVGSVWNGVKAIESIHGRRPDLVTLDLEMPEMDGLETLQAIQKINEADPSLAPIGVIMVSAHTHKGAEITIQALELGAFDFIAKPEGKDIQDSLDTLRSQLTATIRAFALDSKRNRDRAPSVEVSTPIAPTVAHKPVSRPRPVSSRGETAVLIGISTGGPKALSLFLPDLLERIHVPVFIVQHMPPVFTASLAQSLDRKSHYRVIEARDRDEVRSDTAYIAPGGLHLVLRRGPLGQAMTSLNDQPPENNCKPAADVLFRSAAPIYGPGSVALILTGMGTDGTNGLAPLRRAGSHVIAQDEPTSVVWGMPGSAVAAGVVDQVLPLLEIPAAVAEFLNKN